MSRESPASNPAAHALLGGIIDYAGLFPPARLDLPAAVANYDFYSRGEHAWILARFVLPSNMLGAGGLPSRITLTHADGPLPELPPEVESVETKSAISPAGRVTFYELDWRTDFATAMDALPKSEFTGVKLRTGGLTPDSIPPAPVVARFLAAAAERGLPIKFTAGLHSPFPAEDVQVGARVHGFLNVFAAAFAAYQSKAALSDLQRILTDYGPAQFRCTATHFEAGTWRFKTEDVRRLRAGQVISFGSCSFLEPIEHLQRHGIL